MKKSILKSFSVALVTAMMGLSVPVASAQAGSSEIYVSGSGSEMHRKSGEEVSEVSHKRDRNFDRDRGHIKRGEERHVQRNICSPREAVYTAQRIGMRHAEINRIDRRLIVVSGRKHGKRYIVGMERYSRHCNIAFVHGGRNGGHQRGYRF